MKEGKMSKSKGNLVYPMDVVERYGLDALRYYLVKEMPLGNDGLFTWERFIERFNVDLANDLGNLVSRTISMINKYFDGNIRKVKNCFEYDQELEDLASSVIDDYNKSFTNFRFQDGLNAVWSLISRTNKYIDETCPWTLAKDETKKDELMDVMYHLYEVLRIVSIMISPVMVDTSKIIFEELGLKEKEKEFKNLFFGLDVDNKVIEKAIILFKRLDLQKELEELNK